MGEPIYIFLADIINFKILMVGMTFFHIKSFGCIKCMYVYTPTFTIIRLYRVALKLFDEQKRPSREDIKCPPTFLRATMDKCNDRRHPLLG